MKKKYYVDFEGYCEIEADNEDEAAEFFWEKTNILRTVYEMINVEEKD